MSKLWPLYRLLRLIERFFPKERKKKRMMVPPQKLFYGTSTAGPDPVGLLLPNMEGQLLLSLDERPVKTVKVSGAASFFFPSSCFFFFFWSPTR
jgi:hypothetical protein